MAVKNLDDFEFMPISKILECTPPPEACDSMQRNYPGTVGYWCRYFMAVTVSMMIEDAVVLCHGPLGCTSAARAFIVDHYKENFGQQFTFLPSTNMSNEEVIMGGTDKLEQALLDVDRDYKPPLIIVHDNCCSGVIMDDCQGVIDNLKDRVQAKMIYIPSPGFTTCWADNMTLNMPHYVQIMDPPEKVDPEKVNLIGMYKELYSQCGHVGGGCNWDRKYPTDSHELASYITGMGLKLHRVLMSGGYEYIRTAPEAAINTHNCVSWGHPLGLAMKERFGTKMMHHAFPIGVEATNRWIMELAEATDRVDKARSMMKDRSQEARELTKKAREMVAGKVAIIEGVRNALSSTTKSLAMARFADELGLTPYIVNLHPAFISSKPYVVNFFVDDGTNPQTLYGPYPYGEPVNITMVMEKMGWKEDDVVYFPCDVYDYDRAGKFDPANVPRVNTGQPFRRVKGRPRYLGYSGTAGILRDLMESLNAAKRGGRRPTAYGRMFSKSVEDLITPIEDLPGTGH